MKSPCPNHKKKAIDNLTSILRDLSSKRISDYLTFDGRYYCPPQDLRLPSEFLDPKTGKFFIWLSLYLASWANDAIRIDLENDKLVLSESAFRKKLSRWYKDKPEAWISVERNTGQFRNAVKKPGGLEYMMGLILSKKEECGGKTLDGGKFYAIVTMQIFEAGAKHRLSRRSE